MDGRMKRFYGRKKIYCNLKCIEKEKYNKLLKANMTSCSAQQLKPGQSELNFLNNIH